MVPVVYHRTLTGPLSTNNSWLCLVIMTSRCALESWKQDNAGRTLGNNGKCVLVFQWVQACVKSRNSSLQLVGVCA